MNEITIKAYAKINLALDVLGLLENGYHELDMIMHQIELHDDVTVKWEPDDSGQLKIKLSSGRDDLPEDKGNIAYRAVLVMAEGQGKSGTVSIDIKKVIPVAAGLAGGSGNGAAVIHGLNILWDMNMSLDELMAMGKKIGSDVPFSIAGQGKLNDLPCGGFTCARATYDGTVLEPLPNFDSKYVVLSKPDIGVSTKEVYQGIDSVDIPERPDISKIVQGIKNNNIVLVAENMVNVLENYTLNRYNCIMELVNSFKGNAGCIKAMMSGSGPSVFCIMENLETAEQLADRMRQTYQESYLTWLV